MKKELNPAVIVVILVVAAAAVAGIFWWGATPKREVTGMEKWYALPKDKRPPIHLQP